jgi:DNA polymerase-3 subunit delta'
MLINDLPIASGLKEEVANLLGSGNVPHACLLTGSDGGAQMSLAFFLASSFLCNHSLSGMACGKCSSCNKAGQMIHPDIHFSYPLNSSTEDAETKIELFRELMRKNIYSGLSDWIELLGAENSVLNIHAKECSRIERVLSMKSFEGKGKVLIIWLPEFLGNEGNKLLKTIEEPESGTRIILAACDQKAILPTIVSRCRVFRISDPGIEALSDFLCANFKVSEEVALNAAAIAEGNINDALKNINNEKNIAIGDDFLEWVRLAFLGDPMGSMNFIEAFTKTGNKEKIRTLFRFGIFYFSQVLRARYKGDFIRLNNSFSQSVEKMSSMLDINDVEKIVKELEEFLYFIDRFANNKILLTKATLSIGGHIRSAYNAEKMAV